MGRKRQVNEPTKHSKAPVQPTLSFTARQGRKIWKPPPLIPAHWIEFAMEEGTFSMDDIHQLARQLTSRPMDKPPERPQPPPQNSQLLEDVEQYILRLRQLFTHNPEPTPNNKRRMIVLVMYDITDDRVRNKLAAYLESKGLMRIQYSVFLGEIPRKTLPDLKNGLAAIQDTFEPNDSIIITPLPQHTLDKMHIIGKQIDLRYALMRIHTVVI